MHEAEIILGLLVAVAALVTVSRRFAVPYPVWLVFGGMLLALLPGLPSIDLKPDLVFVLFLPPLLYRESVAVSLRDVRANLRPILSLAMGLVLATTGIVAIVAHWAVPGLPWPAAFVLGAILAPTDEVAVAEVAERLSVPWRLLTILEVESLVNDAVSLVAYRMAIAAAVTRAFSLASASVQFFVIGAGGLIVGLALGWAIAWLRRSLHDPPVENTISLLTPFAAYLSAEALGVSGVLAVVTVGAYVGREVPRILLSQTRLQADVLWEMRAFLLNGLLFILTGLQLRAVLRSDSTVPTITLLADAALIVFTVIGVRFAWIFFNAYVPRVFRRRRPPRTAAPSWREAFLVAWTGIRGGISLATALAVPLTLEGGAPFPQRGVILFLSFCVILATLTMQGLSLPWVIRRLHLADDDALEHEETKARLAAVQAALAHLSTVAPGIPKKATRPRDGHPSTEEELTAQMVADLKNRYLERAHLYEARLKGAEDHLHEASTAAYQRLRRELIEAERSAVIRLRDEGVINDEVLRRIQRDLDLEEVRLGEDMESPRSRVE